MAMSHLDNSDAPDAMNGDGVDGSHHGPYLEEAPQPPGHFLQSSPGLLATTNPGLADFLRQDPFRVPLPEHRLSADPAPTKLQYGDLAGDACDLQGIKWTDMGVSRREAREERLLTYVNFVHHRGSDLPKPCRHDRRLPVCENFFRFRRMDIRPDVVVSHFQLRNVLAATSRTHIYYPCRRGAVVQFNSKLGTSRTAMQLPPVDGDPRGSSNVSTLAQGCGVLVAGGFHGEFMVQATTGEYDAVHQELVKTNDDQDKRLVNHVDVYAARTGGSATACFASNDKALRTLHVDRLEWASDHDALPFAPNCTTVSPCGRLRMCVGDSRDIVVVAADGSGAVRELPLAHRDWSFACAWADDGYTVATASQDRCVAIWDARRWTVGGYPSPVHALRSDMATVRSLRFSPVGSGPRVLVAAEDADYVSVIDARDYETRQTFDFFGEIGGTEWIEDGGVLLVLVADRDRGGVVALERCAGTNDFARLVDDDQGWPSTTNSEDWPRSMFTEHKRVRGSLANRRRAAAVRFIEPF